MTIFHVFITLHSSALTHSLPLQIHPLCNPKAFSTLPLDEVPARRNDKKDEKRDRKSYSDQNQLHYVKAQTRLTDEYLTLNQQIAVQSDTFGWVGCIARKSHDIGVCAVV